MSNEIKIVIVLDQSGSMQPLKQSTIESFDGFVDAQKALDGKATLSLYRFGVEASPLVNYDIQHVKSLAQIGCFPNGGTALYDAIGKAISLEVTSGSSGILVILTDGEENSSRFYNKAQVSKMVSDIQELNGWEVIFLGANITNFTEFTKSIGIKGDKSFLLDCTARGMHDAYTSINAHTTSYRSMKNEEFNPKLYMNA